MEKFQVLVVSAWERGFWIARRFWKMGLKVAVWDVSECFPAGFSHREGPFDFFMPQGFSHADKTALLCSSVQDRGFVLLSPDGPVEFNGPLTGFLFSKNFPPWITYLNDVLCSGYVERPDQLVNKNHGDRNRLFLFSDYVLKEFSRKAYEQEIEKLQAEGMSYFTGRDLALTFKPDQFLFLSSGQKLAGAENLVWCLSGPETRLYFAEYAPELFSQNAPDPVWYWQPFLLRREDFHIPESFPSRLLLLPERIKEKAPFFNQSDLMVLKQVSRTFLELWVLLPREAQGRSQILKEHLLQSIKKMSALWPHAQKKTSPFPQPLEKDIQNYFVLYKEPFFFDAKKRHVFHLNPEGAGRLDPLGLVKKAQDILLKISQMKNKA